MVRGAGRTRPAARLDPDAPIAPADDGPGLRARPRAEAFPRSATRNSSQGRSAPRTFISGSEPSPTVGVFLVGDASGYDDPTTGDGIAIGMLLAERLAEHVGEFLSGRDLLATVAAARYAADHADLVRERRRLTQLALFLARSPWLSRRAIRRARRRSARALGKLVAINCGYQTFRDLTPRDWLLAGRDLTAAAASARDEPGDAAEGLAIPGDRVEQALLGANARDEHRGIGEREQHGLREQHRRRCGRHANSSATAT